MQKRFSHLLLLMALVCGAATHAAPLVRPRYVPKLIELTEKNSPNIAKARQELEIIKAEYDIIFWKMFPTLDIESHLGLEDLVPVNTKSLDWRTTPWISDVNLSISQRIYDVDNAFTFGRVDQARLKYERAKIEFTLARDQQYLNMVNAYYDWSTTRELREIEENKRDLLRRQFNILNSQYKQGLKTKRDVLRIETEIRRLEIDIRRRDNEIDLNFQKLASAVGVSMAQLDAEEIESEQAKPFAVVQAAAPELKVSEHRRAKIFAFRDKEMEHETGYFENNYYPRVTWENDIRYVNNDYVDNVPWEQNERFNFKTLITLRWNLFDWGVRRRDLERARINERKVHNENEQVLRDLAVELREVFLKLNESRENVSATRELLVLEQQSYSVLESEYRNGRAAYLDLITNLNSLINARSGFMNSYFEYKKQAMRYSFHKGSLYEDLQKQ